jgi:hypothetical protein
MSDEFQAGLPAKYQDTCAALTEELEADCVMLVVVGGIRGEGFSVSARQDHVPDLHTDAGVARYLRMLADRVEKRGGRGFNLRAASKKGQRS